VVHTVTRYTGNDTRIALSGQPIVLTTIDGQESAEAHHLTQRGLQRNAAITHAQPLHPRTELDDHTGHVAAEQLGPADDEMAKHIATVSQQVITRVDGRRMHLDQHLPRARARNRLWPHAHDLVAAEALDVRGLHAAVHSGLPST